MISDCTVDPVSALLSYARLSEVDRSDSEALSWYPSIFALAMVIAVSEWNLDGSNKGSFGGVVPGAVHSKVLSRYADEFLESDMKRYTAEKAQNCIKTGVGGLRVIPSIEQKRAFVRDIANRRDEREGETEDVDESWDIEGLVSVNEMPVSEASEEAK